jgi:hypothetical protein
MIIKTTKSICVGHDCSFAGPTKLLPLKVVRHTFEKLIREALNEYRLSLPSDVVLEFPHLYCSVSYLAGYSGYLQQAELFWSRKQSTYSDIVWETLTINDSSMESYRKRKVKLPSCLSDYNSEHPKHKEFWAIVEDRHTNGGFV